MLIFFSFNFFILSNFDFESLLILKIFLLIIKEFLFFEVKDVEFKTK